MLPYNNRLVKRKDFEKVHKLGRYSFAGNIGLKFVANDLDETRIGVAVGIKFSKKAVVRNTIKRKLRELLRKDLGKIKKGYDVVVSIKTDKSGQNKIESRKLEKDLAEAYQKAGLLKE
jgi:ribonuclease P protein component